MSKLSLLIIPSENDELINTNSEVIKVNDINDPKSLETLKSRGTDIFDDITINCGEVHNLDSISGIIIISLNDTIILK